MDVITTALTAAITDGGASAAYQMLKTRLAGKSPRVDEAIADLEDDAGSLSRQFAVSDALAAAGLAGDRYLRAAARNLVEEVDRHSAAQDAAAREPNHAVLQVYYATDRAPTGDRHPARQFGAARGELSYGRCEVSIPREGIAGDGSFPALLRLQARPAPAPHAVLLRVDVAPGNAWFSALADGIGATAAKSALLFVHGYRVSFEGAARRTARLAGALRFPGLVLSYSWPSQGRLSGYGVDETNVEWTTPHLTALLTALLDETPVEHVFLVAHGMGVRALAAATAGVLRARPELGARLQEIVYLATDSGTDASHGAALALVQAGIPVTLYASAPDVVVPGIETVAASDAEADFAGRGASGALLADMRQLITERLRAAQRSGLHAMEGPAGRYWTFHD